MSERVFRSNRPGYQHPVSSELENSGIRVAVGDCSVTERLIKRAKLPVHAKHNEDGHTAPGVCGNGSVPLSYSGERRYENWNTHTHFYDKTTFMPSSMLSRQPNCFKMRAIQKNNMMLQITGGSNLSYRDFTLGHGRQILCMISTHTLTHLHTLTSAPIHYAGPDSIVGRAPDSSDSRYLVWG